MQNADGSWPESGVDLKGEKGDAGKVALSDAVDSESRETAASSLAVKTAYDAATAAGEAADAASAAAGAAQEAATAAKETADEAVNSIRIVSNSVKKKLTQETVFYVNGETGDDALDEGRGLSESKPFRTAQAAIDHICGGYDFQSYNCFLDLSEDEFPEFLVIPEFDTLTGQLRIRGAGADKTVIRGSILTRHSYGIVAIEKSLTVRCPEQSTPGFGNSWYGVLNYGVGAIDFDCSIDAGSENGGIYKYGICLSQAGGIISIFENAKFSGSTTNFLLTIGGVFNIAHDFVINGTIVGDGATSVARFGGKILIFAKDDLSFPVISGSVVGRRFYVDANGIIATSGQGPNYFPGTEEGTVDDQTGGIYA